MASGWSYDAIGSAVEEQVGGHRREGGIRATVSSFVRWIKIRTMALAERIKP